MLEVSCRKEYAVLRVAVVGSGPSGVYTAQALVGQPLVPGVLVDVLDRLPCPYGLVRYGVAPDHEKIKSLQNTLRSVLEHDQVRFLGNVEIGAHGLTPERLLGLYHAVVYCVGAARDRRLRHPRRGPGGQPLGDRLRLLVQRAPRRRAHAASGSARARWW